MPLLYVCSSGFSVALMATITLSHSPAAEPDTGGQPSWQSLVCACLHAHLVCAGACACVLSISVLDLCLIRRSSGWAWRCGLRRGEPWRRSARLQRASKRQPQQAASDSAWLSPSTSNRSADQGAKLLYIAPPARAHLKSPHRPASVGCAKLLSLRSLTKAGCALRRRSRLPAPRASHSS